MNAAGFWIQPFHGGDLTYVDAHPELGSTVTSIWPRMDRWTAYQTEGTVDWILNAAAASRERVARAFRAIYPGARVEQPTLPSEWWGRQFGGLVAIEFSSYGAHQANTQAERSQAGLRVDEADDGTLVTGFPGGSGGRGSGQGRVGRRGGGPGGGAPGTRSYNAGGGGHGTSTGSSPGVPAAAAIAAIISGEYTAENLSMGGGGGSVGYGDNDADGGKGGDGVVRISHGYLTESTSRTLRGGSQSRTRNYRESGVGSGGGYYVICRRGFTLAAEATIDLRHGTWIDGATRGSGLGRFTTFTVDQPNILGTVDNGVTTHFQIYPSIPLGGVLVLP